MSTHDVPGAKAVNADVLAMGAWAEHDDGSLILVEAVEAGRVVYSVFDVAPTPPVEYRTAMPEDGFKSRFSWRPDGGDDDANIQWTWHDKTPFPWDRVMQNFPEGSKHASAGAQLTAAQRVAESLHLRAEEVRVRELPQAVQQSAGGMMQRIRNAIDALVA